MKLIQLVLFFTLWSQWSISQTTYTANNNPSAVTGVNILTGATALQDAVAAASAGDIIYVVRSATDYGATTVDKRLSIYGVGLNPDTDGNERSIVSTITITDPAAAGTIISGLHITTQLGLGGIAGALNNLLIENNSVSWIQHLNATTTLSNIIIRNNIIGSNYASSEEIIDLLSGAIANIVISNNVIYTINQGGQGTISASNGTSIANNLFIGLANLVVFAFESFDGNSVKNNIFYGLRPSASVSLTNNTFENNLSYNTLADAFSSSNGNISTNNLIGQNPLLANVPFSAGIDYSTFDPTLDNATPSPAIGTGEGGTDMSVFGGGNPMDIRGTPLPLVQSITAPTSISQGSDLPVNIKGSGN